MVELPHFASAEISRDDWWREPDDDVRLGEARPRSRHPRDDASPRFADRNAFQLRQLERAMRWNAPGEDADCAAQSEAPRDVVVTLGRNASGGARRALVDRTRHHPRAGLARVAAGRWSPSLPSSAVADAGPATLNQS
jgi:hypothetical protein